MLCLVTYYSEKQQHKFMKLKLVTIGALFTHSVFPVQFQQINKNTNKSFSLSLPPFCSLWAGLKQQE